MTYVLSAFVFPIAALAVLFGLGLLVSAAGGNRVRPELIAPLGLGAVIVLGQYTAWAGIGTPLNVILMLALAIAGYALLVRKGAEFWPEGGEVRSWLYWFVPGILAGGFVLATIVFLGKASMAGFLLDTTSSVQMLGGDMALKGSDNFNSIAITDASTAMTKGYFGATSYPFGSQVALALLSTLTGIGTLWIYTPFMGLMVALTAFGLYRIARLLKLEPGWAAIAAFTAAVPAIVYSNALQGAIKEIVFIPLLIVLALLLIDPLLRSTPRSLAVTGAILATGAIGAIGLAALAWIAPLALAALLAQTTWFRGEWDLTQTLKALGISIAALVVALIPKLGGIAGSLTLAKGLSQTNAKLAADPGNLLGPIHKVQAFGVWLGNGHRVAPDLPNQTFAILGVVVAAAALGALALVARRMWTRVAWVSIMIVLWYVLTWRGTMWLDSKLVTIASSMVMVIAIFGAAQLTFDFAGENWPKGKQWKRRWNALPSYAVAAVIVLGVVASAGIQYLGTGMLPTDRYKELETVNTRFAGQGPAFVPDFDENALYVLRDIGAAGPGNVFTNPNFASYRDNTLVGYGHSADIDNIANRAYTESKLVIQRRGPQRSRPGADYDLVLTTGYYDVFRKNDVKVVEHLNLGNRVLANTVPRCEKVKALAAKAKQDDSLKLVAARSAVESTPIGLKQIGFSGPLAATGRLGGITGAGDMQFTADVKPGQKLWWVGNVSRSLEVIVDGKPYGEVPFSLGGDGNVSGPVTLPVGQHTIVLRRGSGRLTPGGRLGSTVSLLTLSSPETSRLVEIDPDKAEQELCGSQSDWIELVQK
ncbi:MAG: hypothetical protein JHC98_00660 [Thermoleophilaceae bacterium]|nr:hypothetical protein [Thermoleophilaceae bacterium]